MPAGFECVDSGVWQSLFTFNSIIIIFFRTKHEQIDFFCGLGEISPKSPQSAIESAGSETLRYWVVA